MIEVPIEEINVSEKNRLLLPKALGLCDGSNCIRAELCLRHYLYMCFFNTTYPISNYRSGLGKDCLVRIPENVVGILNPDRLDETEYKELEPWIIKTYNWRLP